MMMFRLLSLFVVVACVSAFMPPQRWGAKTATPTQINMFNAENDNNNNNKAKPLETVDSPETATEESEAGESQGMVVKNMNTGEMQEVKWVDPAMEANTNPLTMEWWAFIAFGFPFVLLANDFVKANFHTSFIPIDGPLGFLGRL